MAIVMKSKKISYMTFLQSFAVFLVCFGHSFPLDNLTGEIPLIFNTFHKIIYSFHMPLFFAIAGFLFINSMENKNYNVKFKDFLYKKARRLLIPYFAIGTIAYLFKTYFFNSFAYRPSQPTLCFYLSSMFAPENNPDKYLWFLPVIFVIFLISFFIKRVNVLKLLVISFIILFFVKYIPIHFLKTVLYNIFYFIFGCFVYAYKQVLFKLITNIHIIFGLLILFFVLQFCLTNYLITKVIVALLGIIISFGIALICNSKNQKFLFGILDGKYYQIYLLSWFGQVGLRLFYQLNLIDYMTAVIIMLFGGIFLSIVITDLVERYFPKLKIFIGL